MIPEVKKARGAVTTTDNCISGADNALFDDKPHKTALIMAKFD